MRRPVSESHRLWWTAIKAVLLAPYVCTDTCTPKPWLTCAYTHQHTKLINTQVRGLTSSNGFVLPALWLQWGKQLLAAQKISADIAKVFRLIYSRVNCSLLKLSPFWICLFPVWLRSSLPSYNGCLPLPHASKFLLSDVLFLQIYFILAECGGTGF